MSEAVQADDSTGATDANTELDAQTQDAADTSDKSDEGLEDAYDFGEFQATLSDLKSWREAHDTKQSKDKDYTQKTQAIAKQRDELAAKQEQVDQTFELLEKLQSDLDDMLLSDFKGVDLAALIDEDPAKYERTRQAMETRKQWKGEYQKKLNAAFEKATQEAQKSLFEELGWSGDEAKYKSESAEILEYVKSSGITNRSFSKVTDPKLMVALLKAAKYEALMAKKPAVSKQLKEAPKVTKPKVASSSAPKTLAQRMYPNMK